MLLVGPNIFMDYSACLVFDLQWTLGSGQNWGVVSKQRVAFYHHGQVKWLSNVSVSLTQMKFRELEPSRATDQPSSIPMKTRRSRPRNRRSRSRWGLTGTSSLRSGFTYWYRIKNRSWPVLTKTIKTKKPVVFWYTIQFSKFGGNRKPSDFSSLSIGFLVYRLIFILN
jgi:hypothetical protein